jgi:hypothetical protein
MGNKSKSLLASLLITFAGVASASGLYIHNGVDIGFSGYNGAAPNNAPVSITGPYSLGTLGTLKTDTAGTVTATFLGDESDYNNFFRFFSPTTNASVGTLYEDNDNPHGASISTTVKAGDLIPFLYKDSQSVSVTNGQSNVPGGQTSVSGNWASFAMLYTLSQAGGKVYSNHNQYGTFDFIIGFNDSYSGDADFDDYVVGVKLQPVPLPAAAWLFGSALLGFVSLSNRRKV